MQGKRGINIVSPLNLLKKKAREDRENHEETAVAMFDGFEPEATKRGSFQANKTSLLPPPYIPSTYLFPWALDTIKKTYNMDLPNNALYEKKSPLSVTCATYYYDFGGHSALPGAKISLQCYIT
jgi:hypothetical protein